MEILYLSPLYFIIPLSTVSYLLIQNRLKREKIDKLFQYVDFGKDKSLAFYSSEVTNERNFWDYVIPVALSTIVIAAGLYVTFLIKGPEKGPAFLLGHYFSASSPVKDLRLATSLVAITWSFMGAYIFSLQYIFRRYVSFDLYPRVYYDTVIRILYAVTIALVIRYIFEDLADHRLSIALFFMIGAFPERGLILIEGQLSRLPGWKLRKELSAKNYPLTMIEGISLLHRSRLKELGIDNAQNLAAADFVELLIRTPFRPDTIISWILEAKLVFIFGEKTEALKEMGIYDVNAFRLAYENQNITSETIHKLTSLDKGVIESAYSQIVNDRALESMNQFLDSLRGSTETQQRKS